MQPAWTTADLLPHVCGHITDVHCLAALSAVNKALNHYLFSSTGGKHWVRAGKLVCGEDYWPKDDESIRLENTDPRYLTKIRICPWISEPIDLQRNDFWSPELEKSEHGDPSILTHLNNTQWAPSCGAHYGPMRNIVKLHNGVFIVTSSTFAREDSIFTYFVSSKDLRLLRDRFYIMEAGCHETWSVYQGILYMGQSTTRPAPHKLMRFGIRQDKALAPMPPPEHKATVIQAFWSAFRGEMHDALDKIASALGSTVDLSVLTCHNQTLAEHAINGGSFNALKALLQAEPRCVNSESTIRSALQAGREDMAMLIASKIDRAAMLPKSSLWRMLIDEEAESDVEDTGVDINVLCIQHCKGWMDAEDRPIIPPYLRLLCSLCARIGGLAELMHKYFAQLQLDVVKGRKAKIIMELLCHDVDQ